MLPAFCIVDWKFLEIRKFVRNLLTEMEKVVY